MSFGRFFAFTYAAMAIMVSQMGFGAPKPREISVRVKFDRTFYSLAYDSRSFVYGQAQNGYALPLKDCNRSVIGPVIERYKILSARFASQKNLKITRFDIEVTGANGSRMQVARGSPFGTWLREFPRKIASIHAEAQLACMH